MLREYCRYTIDEEWPRQRKGFVPRGAHETWLAPIEEMLVGFEPSTKREELLLEKSLKHFDALTEFGRHRRLAAVAAIPTVMWYVVIVGP